ncbi:MULTISPECIES: S-layer homology domain-containing protein [Paenibacillus]|uniref:SLH domain-containing protein n=1 Tax=Paenibacillus borealis TaxID=160799 RepID=A0ABX3HKQ2_PAEBO|nr:S-layer homology domain-containing protein [Paenibacillus borealis]OMD51259.1 hypothetical protein BSK56_05135 [Paenibacillus borealis]
MKKTWRGFMTVLLGVSMLFGALGSVSAASVPKDIKGHWAQSQLQNWLDNGYLGGYPDGTVKPNKVITRGEYVAFVNRLFGFTDTAAISFKDLQKSNWAYNEVAKAVKAGYIAGFSDKTFRPLSPLTRQEAAAITARLLSLNTGSTTLAFKDSAQISVWARGSVAAVANKKIINGYTDGTFGPKKSLTRAEAVTIIGNSVANRPGGSGGTVTPTPTPTTAPTATPAPSATPAPTPIPTSGTGGGSGGGGGNGGGGGITVPSVSGVTYGHVGVVTAEVYLTPSVTGDVYYVVAPYSSTVSAPSALQIRDGLTSAGTAGVNSGKTAATGNTTVSFSVYGLQAGTEYAAYVTLADSYGNWSVVSTLRLTTAASSATSITAVKPGEIGTVTADVYVTYGQASGTNVPVRYVVLPANAADPSAAQIAQGKDSAGIALSAPWTGLISPAPAPGVRQTLGLTGLTANTSYKVYLITGSENTWSPVEILRIHTK